MFQSIIHIGRNLMKENNNTKPGHYSKQVYGLHKVIVFNKGETWT